MTTKTQRLFNDRLKNIILQLIVYQSLMNMESLGNTEPCENGF